MEDADSRARDYLSLQNRGYTYSQIAQARDSTYNAVWNSIRRYKARMDKQGISESSLLEAIPRSTSKSSPIGQDLKIFVYDIETSTFNVDVFQLKQRGFISPDNMTSYGRMLCWAGQFIGGPMLFSSEWDHGRDGMLTSLWYALDAADIVVSYNGDSFDNKYVNKEFLVGGMGQPQPYKSIDLIKTVRGKFRFESNKLDYLSERLLDDKKVEHYGRGLWRDVENGVPEAHRMMRKYNIHDVDLTTKLYWELRPWIRNHPPTRFETDGVLCNTCGSPNIQQVGWHLHVVTRSPAYQCEDCSAYLYTTEGRERITASHTI